MFHLCPLSPQLSLSLSLSLSLKFWTKLIAFHVALKLLWKDKNSIVFLPAMGK